MNLEHTMRLAEGMAFDEYLTESSGKVDIFGDLGVSIDCYENSNGIILSKIVVPKENRNSGLGTKVMNRLTQYADKVGKPIALTPSKDFGGTVSKLKEFYSRFGFVPNSGKNKDFRFSETFIREPRT